MTRNLLAVVLLGCCFVACGDDEPSGGGGTETLRLTAENAAGDLAYCDSSGYCESLPNPGHCATLVITVDTQTGKTCERCEGEDGKGVERCGDTSLACVIVTLPEPDCVVCAYINGSVIYSSCEPSKPPRCETVDCAPIPVDACPGGGTPRPDPNSCCGYVCPPQPCLDVACPAIARICPDGQDPIPDPNSCCGTICPPVSCDNVACASFAACPPGTTQIIAPPNCCGTCVPKSCASSAECPESMRCSVERGDCLPCDAPAGVACPAVCRGVCEEIIVVD